MRLTKILWGRRIIILTATLSCAMGGATGYLTSPPLYEATAKVDLQLVKQDPVTGASVNSKNAEIYVDSQIKLVRDFPVTIRTAELLGWLDSPEFQGAFADTPHPEGLDFKRWVGLRVGSAVSAVQVAETNILALKFRGNNPEQARAGVDALRQAYLEATVNEKKQSAQRGSEFQTEQAGLIRAKLVELERQKTELERQTGVVLQDNNTDIESSRLRTLATAMQGPRVAVSAPAISQAAQQLAQSEMVLASVTRTLGPNHPALNALKDRHNTLMNQVAMERSSAGAVAQGLALMASRSGGRMDEQISTVLSQRETLTKLHLLKDEIDRRRDEYNETSERAVQLAQISRVGDATITPVGFAENTGDLNARTRPLTLLGSAGLGLSAGILLSLFLEFLRRRVRSEEDLRLAVSGSIYAAVPLMKIKREKARRRWPRLGLLRRRPRVAAAA